MAWLPSLAQNSYNAGVGSGTGGSFNVFVGPSAGRLTSGAFNSLVGSFAGSANTTGSNNTFLGYQAGNLNTTGSGNSFLGSLAGFLPGDTSLCMKAWNEKMTDQVKNLFSAQILIRIFNHFLMEF